MSDLAYHIATEHKLRFHEPSLTTTCSLPTCGMEPRLVYDESAARDLEALRVSRLDHLDLDWSEPDHIWLNGFA